MSRLNEKHTGQVMGDTAPHRDSTFRAGPLVNIPSLLIELGCDPDPVFERADFKRSLLDDTEHRLSFLAANRLLQECVLATKCEHFGLLLGQMANPSYLGVTGFLVSAASTVGQALEALVTNLDLHDEGTTCALNIEEDYSRLSFHVHQPRASAIAQIHDLATVIMCKIMRSLCGKDWNASQVLVMRERPRDLTPYTHYYRTTPLFSSEVCGIVFPNHYLYLRPPKADKLLYHHLELEAKALHRMRHDQIMDALPAVMQKGLLLGQCSVRDIADAFGLHERTFHRRLQFTGTTFRQELDHVRELLSIQLLRSSGLPICDIAASLGYADSSGFIRAFHRWTGFSPAAWRKQNVLH